MAARVALARESLRSRGVSADVHVTTGAGHAHRLAEQAVRDGVDLVIAWGGDGTINEVASALVFGSVPLGIVPGGSGNGLATDLGIPADPAHAFVVAATGQDRPIDAGVIGGEWFFNIAGIGLDATIADRFAARGSRRRGPLAYVQLMASEILRSTGRRYTLTFDDERIERTALMIALANSRQYGIGALIAPRALVDDGRLELVVVEDQSLLSIVWRMPSLFRGTLEDSPGLLIRSVVTAKVAAEGAMRFHVDGEPRAGGDTLDVRVHPGVLRVRVSASHTTSHGRNTTKTNGF
jgi:YegS/Rv2252/BmrU family lipid kinase